MKTNKNTNAIDKLILEDHKPLKKLIKCMKDDEASISDRKEAFEEFAPLLLSHAKAEEEALYTFLKAYDDLREQVHEAQVEHSLAEQMVSEVHQSKEEEMVAAKIKVLAELVEHHIEEEEDDLLPEFKKHADTTTRVEIGERYLDLKEDSEENKKPLFSDTYPTIHSHN